MSIASPDTIAKCGAGCGRDINVDIVGPICGHCAPGQTKSPIAKCRTGCGRTINMLYVGTICGYCKPRASLTLCTLCRDAYATTSYGFCSSCYSNQVWHKQRGLPGAFSSGK